MNQNDAFSEHPDFAGSRGSVKNVSKLAKGTNIQFAFPPRKRGGDIHENAPFNDGETLHIDRVRIPPSRDRAAVSLSLRDMHDEVMESGYSLLVFGSGGNTLPEYPVLCAPHNEFRLYGIYIRLVKRDELLDSGVDELSMLSYFDEPAPVIAVVRSTSRDIPEGLRDVIEQ